MIIQVKSLEVEAQTARKQRLKVYLDAVTQVGCSHVFCETGFSFGRITALKTVWPTRQGVWVYSPCYSGECSSGEHLPSTQARL